MDRNLGAFSNTNNTEQEKFKTQGLMYQWGRKDPFPPVSDINNTTTRPLVNNHVPIFPQGKNFATTLRTNWSDALTAYTFTVRNPMTFITTNASPHEWATENFRSWYLLNNEFYKSEFDPCPDGWYVPSVTYPWGSPSSNRDNFFFVPLPDESNIADFGYTKSDGYFFPVQGVINQAGNYESMRYYAGAWTTRYNVDNSTGTPVYKGLGFRILYETGVPNPYSYLGEYKSWAMPVRCSRVD